ncbi:MAG: hypothetical protein ACR2OU_11060, partial [Thermomicrobiales bacterium]
VHGSAIINNQSDYSFETVSGSLNLNVVLPADTVSTLNFKSLSGSGNAGGDWQSDGKRSWHAGSGGAGPTLRVKTVSGSMNTQAHVESSIPTRHEALTEPTFPEPNHDDADQVTAPFPPMSSVPSVPPMPSAPPVPPMPPTGSGTHGYQAEHPDLGNTSETQPIFTPPADWPDWIKSTARTVEETARHVVTSFQQPVEPLPPMDEQRPQPGKTAPTDAAWTQRPVQSPASSTHATTNQTGAIGSDQVQAAADQRQAEVDRQQAIADQKLADIDRQHAEDMARQNASPNQAHSTSPGVHQVPAAQASQNLAGSTASAAAPTADTRSLDNQDEAERLRILEALERGDIDIDEALSKIEQEESRGA